MIIKSIEQLKALSTKGLEVSICLNGGLRSSKYIQYSYGDKKFYINNYIDGSQQELNEAGLKTFSNITEAIEKGALITD